MLHDPPPDTDAADLSADLLDVIFRLERMCLPNTPTDLRKQLIELSRWVIAASIQDVQALVETFVSDSSPWANLRLKQLCVVARLFALPGGEQDIAECIRDRFPSQETDSTQHYSLSLLLYLATLFEQLVDLLRDAEPAKVAVLLSAQQRQQREPLWVASTLSIGTHLSILIHELSSRKATFGGHTWRAAPALCSYLLQHTELVKGRRVLELGCGTGVCGIVSSLLGAKQTILTDFLPAVIDNAKFNLEINHCANAVARPLYWPEVVEQGGWDEDNFDLVIASDCVYEERHGEVLPRVAALLLSLLPSAVFLSISPAPQNGRLQRAGLSVFEQTLEEIGFVLVRSEIAGEGGHFVVRRCSRAHA